jgi:hypothetical protein
MAQTKPARSKVSASQKIAEATSAAPAEIGKNATIMDWPEQPGGQPQELRKSTNDWVCFPSSSTEFGAASQQDPGGGPWVMWKGTPDAHLMRPVAPKATMKTGAPGATRSSQ